MHSLEQMLFILARRIEDETGNKGLARDTMSLASYSHWYAPEGSESAALTALSEEWTKKYKNLLTGA
jgi:hypothetical protein